MHRLLAVLLTAALAAALALPAMAAPESADARLARVTQAVKDVLALDTEAFTDFYGDVSEQELGTVWSLRWSGDGVSLNVEALDDGTVVGLWRSDGEAIYRPNAGGGLPTLPKRDGAAAKVAAEAFLARVLDAKTESVVLGEPAGGGRIGGDSLYFSGRILLNGLPSPLNYSVTVRGGDNEVTSFHRDAPANSFLGSIPSASPAVSRDAAAEALKGTLKLELVYVSDENDASRAVLRYVPKEQETRWVDAQTGALVSPSDELFFSGSTNDADTPAAAESAKLARGLTQAELAGVEKLEGVLDSAALDALVRQESAYGLDGCAVASADYRLVKGDAGKEDTVLCTLRYAAPREEDGFAAGHTFTVDARTGAVQSLYSNGRWDKERASAVSAAAARQAAEAFLARFTPHAGEFALYGSDDRTGDGAPFYGFTFARRVNGCFFPENACAIQIDRMTGAVAGVSLAYDEKIAFDGTAGVVSEAAALDAWMGTYDVTLAYRALPKELSADIPAEAKLIDLGYTRFRTLFLSYGLEREAWVPGIDAKTGKPVETARDAGEIAYSDVAGHWAAAEIGALAAYGVGYAGDSFRPDKPLTQWELVALLASVRGLRLDPENASREERDNAYGVVYDMGALTRAQRSDDAALTRGALVRCLLDAAGFGAVARLRGIFTCSYADRADIPAADLGYAALAQGLGLAANERFDGGAAASRAAAAVMLYRLMTREG